MSLAKVTSSRRLVELSEPWTPPPLSGLPLHRASLAPPWIYGRGSGAAATQACPVLLRLTVDPPPGFSLCKDQQDAHVWNLQDSQTDDVSLHFQVLPGNPRGHSGV